MKIINWFIIQLILASPVFAGSPKNVSEIDFNDGTVLNTAGNLATIPVSSLTVSGVSPGSYTNTNLTVNAQGIVTAASTGPGGGGGSSILAVGTGTASNFTNIVTSPTVVISLRGGQFLDTASGTTNFMALNPSSVTLLGQTILLNTNTSGIYLASATAGNGILVTGTNNTAAAAPILSADTTFLMTQSSASTNLLSQSSATATYFNKNSVYVSSINGSAAVAVTPNGTSGSNVTVSQISSSSTLMGQLVGGSGITITQGSPSTTIASQNVSSLTASGVVAATYGSATNIPVFTVTAQGIVTSVSNTLATPNAASITAGSLGINVLASSFPVSGVSAGTYGNSTNVSSITINAQGIVTGAANVAIAFPAVSLSTMTAGATNYVFNQGSLNQGATFYVSSGSVSGQLTVGTLQGASLTTCGDSSHGLGWTGGSFNCQSITGSGGSGVTVYNATATAGFPFGSSISTITVKDAVRISTSISQADGQLPPWGLYVGEGTLTHPPILFTDTSNDGISFAPAASFHYGANGLAIDSSGSTVATFSPGVGQGEQFLYPLTVSTITTPSGYSSVAISTSVNISGSAIISTSITQALSNSNDLFQVGTSTTVAIVKNGHTENHQPIAPVESSCGGAGPNIATGSSDIIGAMQTGTAATSCTLTFGSSWTNAPFCVVSDNSTVSIASITSISSTQLVVGLSSSLSGGFIYYFCQGYQ